MKLKKWVVAACLCLVMNVSDSKEMKVYSTTKDIAELGSKLFHSGNFEVFNSLSENYLDLQDKFKDGRWKLSFLYERLGIVEDKGSKDEWNYKLNAAEHWIESKPDQAAAYLAKSKVLLSLAWAIRGTKLAHKVSKSRWKQFDQLVAKARKVLDDSVDITGKHPYRYALMIEIAKLQSWPNNELNELFEEAVSLYPDYYRLYFEAAEYFLPRWQGSKLELKSFVNRSLEGLQDRKGHEVYARIFWSLLWVLKDKTFDPGYAEWPLMKKGFEDMMHNNPDSDQNLNAFAYYACMAKDWSTFETLFAELKGEADLRLWDSYAKFYGCMRASRQSSAVFQS